MFDPTNLFSHSRYQYKDGVYRFSEMDASLDSWQLEHFNCVEEDRLVEFLPDKKYFLGLETGAGIGRCTAPLSRICEKLVALEPSNRAIEWMQKRELNNTVFVASCDVVLPFRSHMFDLVANITVIEHIPKKNCRDFIREHFRVLRPGGIFIIRNDAWFYRVLEKVGYFDKKFPDPTHVNMITPRRLGRILSDCGFEIIRSDYFPFYRYTKLKLPLMNVLATKGNYVCRKPV